MISDEMIMMLLRVGRMWNRSHYQIIKLRFLFLNSVVNDYMKLHHSKKQELLYALMLVIYVEIYNFKLGCLGSKNVLSLNYL